MKQLLDEPQTEVDIDSLNEKILTKFDEFLSDPKVIQTMGTTAIVQAQNILIEMQKECKSKIELMIFNDKLLNYLIKQYKLQKYEKDKQELQSRMGTKQ